MNKLSLVLSAITIGAMVVFMAPGIFALNRGHILRNTALWLAIFAVLGLIYQNFGPNSPHPLISTPATRAGDPANVVPPATSDKLETKPSDDQSFTPPKED